LMKTPLILRKDKDCMQMTDSKKQIELEPEEMASLSGGQALGIYRPGFRHKKESLRFLKACIGDDVYARAMNSEAGRTHHYVVARTLLNQADWEKFVWIEEHGSLDSFPG